MVNSFFDSDKFTKSAQWLAKNNDMPVADVIAACKRGSEPGPTDEDAAIFSDVLDLMEQAK